MPIVAGVDFGTASVRVSIVHDVRGRLGAGVAEYQTERSRTDADMAVQRHDDHARALQLAFQSALHAARTKGESIEALAVDTTGSTVLPLDEKLRPLGGYYLWCDHRAWREAEEITSRGKQINLPALDWCGGTYSSEWGWAKTLHWLRSNPQIRGQLYTVAEHCDFMVATLCGINDPKQLPRSVCAMGHKWMWNAQLGGLPPEEFIASVDPLLAKLRSRLQGRYLTSGEIAGTLCEEWAARLGLRAGIPIPVGALDAHWDAVGVGCRLGDVVNVIGTSTCIMALSESPRLIPGVAGIVQGSIHPEKVGIEAGLAAVGDLFEAIARRSGTDVASLAAGVQNFRAGQTGLMRFPWDNGDRSVLANPRLRGITLGWHLSHTAQDEFFAAIEGTAFHTRIVLERLEQHGVLIERVIHAGGIPQRNAVLNKIYANVLGKAVLVPATDTTSMGAAIFAFLAAGTFSSVEEAQEALSPTYRQIDPEPDDVRTYENLFARFHELYFRLGHET